MVGPSVFRMAIVAMVCVAAGSAEACTSSNSADDPKKDSVSSGGAKGGVTSDAGAQASGGGQATGLDAGMGDASNALQCSDSDHDGYCVDSDPVDCDDSDEAVYPDQTEVCNGKDDNCDGQIDEAPARQCQLTCEKPDGGCDTPTALVAGARHTCALTASGRVYCWGTNSVGQLGTPDTTFSVSPLRVPGVEEVTQLAGSEDTTCGLQGENAICWGGGPKTPYVVRLPANTVAIGAGSRYLCALDNAGKVSCAQGESVLAGEFSTEIATAAVSLMVAGTTACAVTATGQLMCWSGISTPTELRSSGVEFAALGTNDHVCAKVAGHLLCSDGLTTLVNAISGNESATCVFLSRSFACGMDAEGRVSCWSGSAPAELASVTDVVVGDQHGCVLTTVDEVKCWGSHNSGAVGDGILDGSVTDGLVPLVPGQLHSLPPTVLLQPGLPAGLCDNAADIELLLRKPGSVYDAAATCVSDCTSRLDPNACLQTCTGTRPVSSECAQCFTAFAHCQEQGCYKTLTDCVGFSPDFLAYRRYMPVVECMGSYRCLAEALRLGEPCTSPEDCWSGSCDTHTYAPKQDNQERICLAPICTSCENGDAHCGLCNKFCFDVNPPERLTHLIDSDGNYLCALDCANDHGFCPLGETCDFDVDTSVPPYRYETGHCEPE